MEDNFEHLGPPPEPVNPYESSAGEGAYQQAPMSTGNGTVALWLGVGSMICGMIGIFTFCCFLTIVFNIAGVGLGAFALTLGLKERRAVDAGYSHPSNRGNAQLGVVFGSIGLAFSLLGLFASGGFLLFAVLSDGNNF